MAKCFVTAIVKGKRENITIGLNKKKADLVAKNLRKDMKNSISKYRFAKNIKVECS